MSTNEYKVGDIVSVLDDWGENSVRGRVTEVCQPPLPGLPLLYWIAFGATGLRLAFAGRMKRRLWLWPLERGYGR